MGIVKKIYDEATIKGDNITIEGKTYKIQKGKHSIWIPEPQMKIAWSYNGKIISFRDWEKGEQAKEIWDRTFNDNNRFWDRESLQSIINEFMVFKELMKYNLTVKFKGIFYIKNVISDFYPGTLVSDSKGVYGYYRVKELPDRFENHIEKLLDISDGAKGDLKKEDNVINGYLIDIRRTMWDCMKLKDLPKDAWKQIEYRENDVDMLKKKITKLKPKENNMLPEELKEKITDLTQYPHKQRKLNYQSYYIDNEEVEGSRNTVERIKLMELPEDMAGMTILDLGCNLGSICCESWKRGARWIMGLDNEDDYIECARDLARHNGYNINFMVKDLTKTDDTAIYIKSFFDQTQRPINIIFALSLYKHIKGKMFELLDRLKWDTCIIESHNAPNGINTPHCKEIIEHMNKRKWNYVLLGVDTTRSPRCIWKISTIIKKEEKANGEDAKK